MSSEIDHDLALARSARRRLAIWQVLKAEGVLPRKTLRTFNQQDIDQIDARLLLEDMAAMDGVTIDRMFDQWEAERSRTAPFETIADFLEALLQAQHRCGEEPEQVALDAERR